MDKKLKVTIPQNSRHIVISTGGTGGHIIPALAIHEILQSKHKISWVTDAMGDKFLLDHHESLLLESKIIIISRGLKTGAISKLFAIMLLLWNILLCLSHFIFKRPNIVLSFGSNASAPAALAAIVLRIPLIIHEQNAAAGRTNAFLSRFALTTITSFPNTLHINGSQKLLGLPLRREFCRHISHTKTEYSDKIRILILGGSLGAQIFSICVPQAIALLPEKVQHRLQITQQSRQPSETLQEYLKMTHIKESSLKIQTFFSEVAIEMINADVIICRAGASTIAEIAALNKPAISIPIKNSVNDHQKLNAFSLRDESNAIVIEENDFTPNSLSVALKSVIIDGLASKMRSNTSSERHKKAAANIAVLINNILMNKK